jgi:hypothetical protein
MLVRRCSDPRSLENVRDLVVLVLLHHYECQSRSVVMGGPLRCPPAAQVAFVVHDSDPQRHIGEADTTWIKRELGLLEL